MLSNCIPDALEKRVQVWKIAAVASTVCRSFFVLTLAVLVLAVLSMPRAVVGDCFIIYTDSAKFGGKLEMAKIEGELGEVSVGTEGEKFEAKVNTQGQDQAMRQVRMRNEFTVSNDNNKVLEFRTGACVNSDDMFASKMIDKKDNMLTTTKQCWTDKKCFADSLTIEGEECNCQSKAASESCKQKCFDECTKCNCVEVKDAHGESNELTDCVRDTFLHQQFAWAENECKSACAGGKETSECILCGQKNFIFIDSCAMANPQVGGNQAVCQGDLDFDTATFVRHQDILNCTNPEGCQVYNLDDYAQKDNENVWIPNDYMPVEAWWDASQRWWNDMGIEYPNVFGKSEDGNAVNDLRPIGSTREGGFPWEQHHYPSSRRLNFGGSFSHCKWQYGAWEPLTAPSWSAGSREFQEELVHRVEVVSSSLGSNPGLNQCQTSGMRVGSDEKDLELMSLANWNFVSGVVMAMSFTYILIFAMKTFILRKTWIALTNSLKEMDNSQKETLSTPVSRMEKPGCCSKILGCFVKLEAFCEKIQSPFFSVFIILMPAYTLAPLLQATCYGGFIVAPAGDVWTLRFFEWPLLGFIIWWFVCQIAGQYAQRCKVISQFLNAMSLLPFTYVGGYIAFYELLKLGKTGIGFEFALFFKHMFSFSFSIGVEFAVDLLQLLFSVTLFMDVVAGIAGAFTKRDWKEKWIFSFLVANVKRVPEPAKTHTETSV